MADKETGTPASNGTGGKLTKTEAVRRTLAELGHDADTPRIVAHLRERFGIEMSPKHVATSRSEILRKEAAPKSKSAAAAKKPAAAQPPAAEPTADQAPVPAVNGDGASVRLGDVLAVRDLVDRVGADHLRTLIAAFER